MAIYVFTKSGEKKTEEYDSLEEAIGIAARDLLSNNAWPEEIMDAGVKMSSASIGDAAFVGLDFTDEEKQMVLTRAKQQQNTPPNARRVTEEVSPLGFEEGL